MNFDLAESAKFTKAVNAALPEWCNVYGGLTTAEIDRLDQATQQRLELTRSAQ